ncbi:extracellular solute-binding protein [Paenibacillus sp. IB182496]|uniref:Extracellular solute-binding protein n=1 Tax=Paenibacillus sabuli TaxID=2772509 RepID=A0A927BVU9_9BACL|nr:extracellular solute-binding protein [Paenibacillus sabuli]MBD2846846.1 extracellular solute-binding protein [Paenibacillus sabuli]
MLEERNGASQTAGGKKAVRKKAALAAMVTAAMLLLAACGGNNDGTSGGNSDDAGGANNTAGNGESTAVEGSVELKVFGGSASDALGARADNQKEIEQTVLDGFIAENPEVKSVTWDAQGPVADQVTRMMTANLGGEYMDMVACAANPTNTTFIDKGILKDITADIEPFKDRIDPSALNAYSRDGKVYGIPIATMSTSTFYYNKDLFAELGLEVPTTYEELLTVSEAVKEAGHMAVIHQGKNAWYWPMWLMETLAQTSGDSVGKTESNLSGETKFTDEADVEALRLVGQFVEDGIIDGNTLTVDTDGMRSAFASQQAAMYYGGTWELSWLQDNVTDFEYGAFEFPKLPDTIGDPKHGGGPDYGICVSSNIKDDNQEYAIKLMEYLTRPEVADQYLGIYKPIFASIEGVTLSDEPIAQDLQGHYDNTVRFLDWIWPVEVKDAIASSLQGIAGGMVSAEEAAATIQAAYDQLVADGYVYGE